MIVWPIFNGVFLALFQVATPFVINLPIILLSYYLSQNKLRPALAAAIGAGLVLELFSPLRFGFLLATLLAALLLTQFTMTRLLSLAGLAGQLAYVGLLLIIVSLPALFLSWQFQNLLAEFAATTAAVGLLSSLRYVRARFIH